MNRKRKSIKRTNRPSSVDTKCKHCGTVLESQDIIKQSRKKLTERYSLYWTGIEQPYIQIYKINCPNPRCRKSYTNREKKSSWLYK